MINEEDVYVFGFNHKKTNKFAGLEYFPSISHGKKFAEINKNKYIMLPGIIKIRKHKKMRRYPWNVLFQVNLLDSMILV